MGKRHGLSGEITHVYSGLCVFLVVITYRLADVDPAY